MKWDWESLPRVHGRHRRMPHTIDVALQVPHDALRVFVPWASAPSPHEAATDDGHRPQMRDAVREALTRAPRASPPGAPTTTADATARRRPPARPTRASSRASPGLRGASPRRAPGRERLRHGHRARALRRRSSTCSRHGRGAPGTAERLAHAARHGARPVAPHPQAGRAPPRAGLPMRVQVAPRAIGVILGWRPPSTPSWVSRATRPSRTCRSPSAWRRCATRSFARGCSPRPEPVAGDGSDPPAGRHPAGDDRAWCRCGSSAWASSPTTSPRMERLARRRGPRRGAAPLEALYDAMLEHDGRELLYFPLYNYTEFNLDVRAMLTHPLALVGLSDGGAHVGTVCDASFPTFLLIALGARPGRRGASRSSARAQAHQRQRARTSGCATAACSRWALRADLNVIDLAQAPPRPAAARVRPARGRAAASAGR
jgi:hypothetical protein